MAPKNKFTRQQLAAAAMDVVRRQGAGALTAKAVAEALDISTRPIFTCFGTMEALRADVCALAQQRFDEYVAEGLRQEIPFLGYGKQYARFAREEPELYRLLMLTSGDGAALRAMRHSQELVRPSLMEIYHITAAEADYYFRDMWLVSHSIATLIVTGNMDYTPEELEQITVGFSLSLCKSIKEIPGFVEGDFNKDALFRGLVEGKR